MLLHATKSASVNSSNDIAASAKQINSNHQTGLRKNQETSRGIALVLHIAWLLYSAMRSQGTRTSCASVARESPRRANSTSERVDSCSYIAAAAQWSAQVSTQASKRSPMDLIRPESGAAGSPAVRASIAKSWSGVVTAGHLQSAS